MEPKEHLVTVRVSFDITASGSTAALAVEKAVGHAELLTDAVGYVCYLRTYPKIVRHVIVKE